MNILKSINIIILLISIPTYFVQAFADTNANGSPESQPSSSSQATITSPSQNNNASQPSNGGSTSQPSSSTTAGAP